MAHSDSDGDEMEDLEFENGTSEADGDEEAEVDDEILDALDNDPDDATEADEESASEESEEGSDDEDDEESEHTADEATMETNVDDASMLIDERQPQPTESQILQKPASPVAQPRQRSLSPAQLRKNALLLPSGNTFPNPRSYTVEAVCAIAHPVPTHALAHSLCMSHLLTGSDDGYIRDYDVFAAVNGKSFLTAPQRHHCGVVEGIMKAGQIRCWWENPDLSRFNANAPVSEEPAISPVYSLLMHSDALWSLAGSNTGHINLFTVRHETGRLCHVMNGHRGPVSALSMEHDEKGYFSAGWDGEALQWDLNTGQIVRKFTAHGAQLVGVAVKPIASPGITLDNTPSISQAAEDSGAVHFRHRADSLQSHPQLRPEFETSESGNATNTAPSDATGPMQSKVNDSQTASSSQQLQDSDAKSDMSYDPLFDDEPDADAEHDAQQAHGLSVPSQGGGAPGLAIPSQTQSGALPSGRASTSTLAVPKNAPPLLDTTSYSTFSPDILMTAAIDGQVILWDKRINTPKKGVGRLEMSEKTPPWCVSACWSAEGRQIYAGRRNGTIDVWDTRQLGKSGPGGTPRLLKTLRNPASSGVVSCVVAFPDGRHIACASNDNIRLWNASDAGEPDASGKTRSGVQFKIIPGHHGGYISQMVIDPAARFLVTASSNRGWHGDSTRTIFVHDIKHVQ